MLGGSRDRRLCCWCRRDPTPTFSIHNSSRETLQKVYLYIRPQYRKIARNFYFFLFLSGGGPILLGGGSVKRRSGFFFPLHIPGGQLIRSRIRCIIAIVGSAAGCGMSEMFFAEEFVQFAQIYRLIYKSPAPNFWNSMGRVVVVPFFFLYTPPPVVARCEQSTNYRNGPRSSPPQRRATRPLSGWSM